MSQLRLFCWTSHTFETAFLAFAHDEKEALQLITEAVAKEYNPDKGLTTPEVEPFDVFEIEIPLEPKVEVIQTWG